MRKRTVRKLEWLLHSITILLLLIKAADLAGRQLYLPSAAITVLSLVSLGVLLLRRELGMGTRKAHIACYYIEAPALLLIAYTLYIDGNDFLPYIFLLAALIYPAVGFTGSKKFRHIKKASAKRRLN